MAQDEPHPIGNPFDSVAAAREDLRRAAAAFGEPRRCRLLTELLSGPLAVHELVDRTGFRQPLVSHHLAVLRQTGLVRDQAEGRLRRYRIEDAPVGGARVLLDALRGCSNPNAVATNGPAERRDSGWTMGSRMPTPEPVFGSGLAAAPRVGGPTPGTVRDARRSEADRSESESVRASGPEAPRAGSSIEDYLL
ncbi:MAG: helix-turn-helix transcriptional regulator [Candidatus Eisenbacteria bacterium]|uniref:Helix-turn-helix transcriptional regulator n=1 Tax=Eiseniibacteriota bacterium TaxID=2212470 RepID=A0A956LXF0_UNCEI|nr:helix-turn-helix transcriptional regulator [Candidatus Eisenbacteria bacterium]